MPIKPRGKSFEATVHHQGERYRKSFTTRAEAESWELSTKIALKKGEIITDDTGSVKTGVRTLQELLDLTHKRYWVGTGGEEAAVTNANKCIELLGPALPPSAVNESRLDDLIFTFESQGLAPATINRRLSALSKMLTFAEQRGYITRKPRIERKKEPTHRVRYVSEREEEELLAYYTFIGQPDFRDLLICLMDTGARLNEMRSVQTRDVEEGLLILNRTKSDKIRSIPLTKRAEAILKGRIKDGELKPTDNVWFGWTNDKIRHLWNHGKSHLGLMTDPQFVPHVLRHTFCSRLVQRGVDIVTVSKLAGHASITMTMRYSHLRPDNLVDAIRALEAGRIKPEEKAA